MNYGLITNIVDLKTQFVKTFQYLFLLYLFGDDHPSAMKGEYGENKKTKALISSYCLHNIFSDRNDQLIE